MSTATDEHRPGGYGLQQLLRHARMAPGDIRATVREMRSAPITEPWRLAIVVISAALVLLDQQARALHVPGEYDLLSGVAGLAPAALLYPAAILVGILTQVVIFYGAVLICGLVLKAMRTPRPWGDIRTAYVAPELVFGALALITAIVTLGLYAAFGPLKLAMFEAVDIGLAVIFLAYAIVSTSEALDLTAGRAFLVLLLSGLVALMLFAIGYSLFGSLAPKLSGAASLWTSHG